MDTLRCVSIFAVLPVVGAWAQDTTASRLWCPPPTEQAVVRLDSFVASPRPELRGVVRARYNQQPVPSARVAVDTAGTVTDSAGHFRLRPRVGHDRLRVLALGYRVQLILLPTRRRGTQWITMELARSCLSLTPMKLSAFVPPPSGEK